MFRFLRSKSHHQTHLLRSRSSARNVINSFQQNTVLHHHQTSSCFSPLPALPSTSYNYFSTQTSTSPDSHKHSSSSSNSQSSKSSSSSSSDSTTDTTTDNFSLYGKYLVLGLTGLGTGYWAFKDSLTQEPDAELIVSPVADSPPLELPSALTQPQPTHEGEFVHPYDDSNIFYKVYLKFKRVCFLGILFVPCAMVSLIAHVSDSPAWREYYLNVLVATLEYAGCSFQKFAQMISMRSDVFDNDLIEALGISIYIYINNPNNPYNQSIITLIILT